MQASLTVSTHFSAAHRLARPDLDYDTNCGIYGKCARPHGHGHDYHLDVTVRGTIDPRTGMVVELGALHGVLQEVVIEPLDHRFLNKDIPYFADRVPTAEHIAIYIRDILQEPLRQLGVTLEKVKLYESPNNSCEVYGKRSSNSATPATTAKPKLVLV
ncbi:6-pyruvoyl tetrahydrobiopterin synthase [Geitlerinema sp. FC II]|nr:6-pyruvoyl tetrahydrobiopterin synthase [Geitlerinema sp. FC II]